MQNIIAMLNLRARRSVLSPIGTTIWLMALLRQEKQCADISDQVINAFPGQFRVSRGLGKNERPLENGLGVVGETFGCPVCS
mgnify:CR=1 FL=1